VLPLVVTTTHSFSHPAGDVDLSPFINARTTRFFGIRVVPILVGGETLQEAYAGCNLVVYQNLSNPFAQPNIDPVSSVDTIPIVDDSVYFFCSAGNPTLQGPDGQQYNVYVLEEDVDSIYPASFAEIAGGSAEPANYSGNVTVTTEAQAAGYTPTTTADGASAANAKGMLLALATTGGTWVDGGPILAWAYNANIGGGHWVRDFENDTTVPAGSAALGATAAITFPDQAFTVGATGRRVARVPAAAAIVGGTGYAAIYQIQD
jgi:hypothetical protein